MEKYTYFISLIPVSPVRTVVNWLIMHGVAYMYLILSFPAVCAMQLVTSK